MCFKCVILFVYLLQIKSNMEVLCRTPKKLSSTFKSKWKWKQKSIQQLVFLLSLSQPHENIICRLINYRRRPRRPPFLRVLSEGIGVTSSETRKLKIVHLFIFLYYNCTNKLLAVFNFCAFLIFLASLYAHALVPLTCCLTLAI